MAQLNPENVPFNQVLKLITQLSTDEQERLRAALNSKSSVDRWQALCSKVQRQSKDLPTLSDDEIVADIKAIRGELKAERAQGRN